jgi:hypothetical protein
MYSNCLGISRPPGDSLVSDSKGELFPLNSKACAPDFSALSSRSTAALELPPGTTNDRWPKGAANSSFDRSVVEHEGVVTAFIARAKSSRGALPAHSRRNSE